MRMKEFFAMNPKTLKHNLAVLQKLQETQALRPGSPEDAKLLAEVMKTDPREGAEKREEDLKYRGGPTGEELE